MRLVIKLSRSAVTTPDPDTGDPIEPPGLKVDILSDLELRDDVTLYGITVTVDGTQVGRVPLTAVSGWPEEDDTEDPTEAGSSSPGSEPTSGYVLADMREDPFTRDELGRPTGYRYEDDPDDGS